MIKHKFIITLALWVLASAGCNPAAAPAGGSSESPPQHLVWEVAGETNRVYLLGSIHLLRENDYPLPPVYERIYDDAEALVMELDMDDLDMLQLQQQMMTAGSAGEGSSLRQILGESQWEKAGAMLKSMGIEPDMLNSFEPWFAALTVVELQMLKLGFDPSLGVEFHFLRRAQTDNKPIAGLESIDEQIAFFDQLPLETQSRFFLKALEDAQTIEQGIEELIGAWRSGDTVAMQNELTRGFDGFPSVYASLVTRRNQAWVRNIASLLDDEDDYLVIVGALHLIGDDSVVALLDARGYGLRQL